MGTLLEVEGEQADAAFEEVERLDRLLSTFKTDSEVSRLNRAAGSGPTAVSEDLWRVLEVSSRVWAASGGAFDPTYSSSPSARGFARLALDPGRRQVYLPAGARLDFGAVGKGYALDAAAAVLRARGVERALLNLGGQVYALGKWRVRTPSGPVLLADASASTSSDAEQPGHIVGADGTPVRRYASSTVIMASAAEADAWSTALHVAGTLPTGFTGCAHLTPWGKAEPVSFGHCPRRENEP